MVEKKIGIVGGSGSGKTTLTIAMQQYFNNQISVLSLDDYYNPLGQQLKDENGHTNFDLPSALNWELFHQHFDLLMAGKTVVINKYQFNNPLAVKEKKIIYPKSLLFVEGIFLSNNLKLFSNLDYIIFLKTTEDLMFKRRMKRDIEERNISVKMIEYQWQNHFLPAYHQYVLNYEKEADFVIDTSVAFNLDEIIQQIK